MRSRAEAGFTLGEVAIALALLVLAVVATLMFFVAGLRSQQQSRYQMYAAAVATSLAEAFSQPREDFLATEGDLTIPDSRTDQLGKAIRDNFLFGSAGQHDLERALATAVEGVYPVPPEIARRLDSPNGEIRRVIDQGGQLYYLDPYPVRGFTAGSIAAGGERSAVPELQRLVFAVVGNAQANILPLHPTQAPRRLLYPFPPQMRHDFIGRRWGAGAPVYQGYPAGFTGDLGAVDTLHTDDPTTGGNALDHGNDWEWGTIVDERAGRPATGGHPWSAGAAWSPWRAGAPEFRRLVHWHWLRIQHQLAQTTLPASGSTTIRKLDPSRKITRTVRRSRVVEDRFRRITVVEWDETISEQDPTAWITVAQSAGSLTPRGIPAPPMGLPQARGLRGTDLLYEDHETNSRARLEQLRIGLPGLERRVMYRTAALALWAKVDGHRPITAAHPEVLGTASDPLSDPNIADMPGNLPDGRNPLLGVVMPPADPRDIHPAQVLALSYLAHAAMMVTGYQPPFIDERNSADPAHHVNLVPDESLPYKDLSAQEFVVRDPFFCSTLPNPDCESGPADLLSAAANDPMAQLDAGGAPILARRYQGPILNPFPPPYADRGAFAWTGQAFARPVPEPGGTGWRVVWRSANYGAGGPRDTAMAKTAHETCLRWAMAYLSEHPYDLVVPKPLNRQTAFDRPLFAYDLFDAAGQARRPVPPVPESAVHTIMWGADHARFGMRNVGALAPWSFSAYRAFAGSELLRPSSTNQLDILALFAPYRTQTQSGPLPDGWAQPRFKPGSATPTQLDRQRQLNILHGIANAPATPLDARVSPRRGRWWYHRPFAVADRSRQLVFWSVDWKAYEDAESAPSATIDRSQLGINLVYSRPEKASPLSGRGNPERWLAWITPARDGTLARPPRNFSDGLYDTRSDALGTGISFQNLPHTDAAEKVLWVALGQWGADRNGNGVWDRGTVPTSVRMRALEVGRYVFYDPVLRATIRN